MGGERQERLLVACNVGENAAEKTWFLCRGADRAVVDPGQGEEARKLVSFNCDKPERRDRQFERCVPSIRPHPYLPGEQARRGPSAPGSAIGFHLETAPLRGRWRVAGDKIPGPGDISYTRAF